MKTDPETLRSLPYFADLPDDLLERVASGSETLEVPSGTQIIQEGTESDEMYVVLEGEFDVTKRTGDKEVSLATIDAGEVVGEIALLDRAARTATVTAMTDAKVVRVPGEAFEDLLSDAGVVRRMFGTVTSRLRGIESTLRHEERMAGLGRMAAQLMHELNNPAAAVGRSSGELNKVHNNLTEEVAFLATRLGEGFEFFQPEPPEDLSPLEMGDREDELAAILEDVGVEDAWELGAPLAMAGWTPELLNPILAQSDDELRPHLARWIGLRASSGQLISEIKVASGRVSELVRVVKEYSYLDQAPVQEVNITSGIDDTLMLLKHKLSHVTVEKHYAADLNLVEAPGRDLNQIWTNLIDNATDAMDEGGVLTITTSNVDEVVRVTIADSGTGIDEETLRHIFDPFFTTKEPGKGTGLGLHTVHNIIGRIGGHIEVESSPSGTTFTVDLPMANG